jgi:hypothetical protein
MSERAKFNYLSILLLLALAIVGLSIANALQAVNAFQQESNATKAGDVNTIRPWMTIHVIAHVYHIPEDYLDSSLHMAKANPLHRATLYEIASHKRQPVDQLIRTLKHIILSYRKEHPGSSPPAQLLRPRISNFLAPVSGETIE